MEGVDSLSSISNTETSTADNEQILLSETDGSFSNCTVLNDLDSDSGLHITQQVAALVPVVLNSDNANDHPMSDDDKVILTLEIPPKIANSRENGGTTNSNNTNQMHMIEDDFPLQNEIKNEGNATVVVEKNIETAQKTLVEFLPHSEKHITVKHPRPNVSKMSEASEKAKAQLERLTKIRANKKQSSTNGATPLNPERNISFRHTMLSKKEIDDEIARKIKKPNTTQSIEILENRLLTSIETISVFKPSQAFNNNVNNGTEIPFNLIDGSIDDSIEPIVEDNNRKEEIHTTEDLIAFLEGDDVSEEPTSYQENSPTVKIENTPPVILNFSVAKPETKNTFIESLVSDWSDNEGKNDGDDYNDDDNTKPKIIQMGNENLSTSIGTIIQLPMNDETTILKRKPTTIPKKSLVAPSPPQPTFKRTRIIKKKIIWDPDAPETQFSYSSLVQPSEAKKPIVKKTIVLKSASAPQPQTPVTIPRKRNVSVNSNSVSPVGGKKKKISELDKLLMDEGAANMLNSLESSTNTDHEKRVRTTKAQRIHDIAIVNEKNNKNVITISNLKTKAKKEIILPKSVTLKAIPASKKNTTAKELKKKDNSWDYIYKNSKADDDSMIIRRRSNSSYSSSNSQRRLSLDVLPTNDTTPQPSTFIQSEGKNEKLLAKETLSSSSSSSSVIGVVEKLTKGKKKFEFVKPTEKKNTTVRRSRLITDKEKVTDVKIANQGNRLNLPSLKYHEHFVEFPLIDSIKDGDSECLLTCDRMKELIKILKSLENENTCRTVLIKSSKNGIFCNGLDMSPLNESNIELRKLKAKDLLDTMNSFLLAIINFPKPLIVAVKGHVKNIGVTLLMAFDIVIADHSVSFSTTYAKDGILPEGFPLITRLKRINDVLINQLFLLCETIPSAVALEKGIISHLVKSIDVFSLKQCNMIASYSYQVIERIKNSKSRNEVLQKIESDLLEEKENLFNYWTNDGVQKLIK